MPIAATRKTMRETITKPKTNVVPANQMSLDGQLASTCALRPIIQSSLKLAITAIQKAQKSLRRRALLAENRLIPLDCCMKDCQQPVAASCNHPLVSVPAAGGDSCSRHYPFAFCASANLPWSPPPAKAGSSGLLLWRARAPAGLFYSVISLLFWS